MDHYTTSLEINSSQQDVFAAISIQLESWWGHQDAPADQINRIFKVSWGEPWYQFKVVKYEKDEGMIWECIDANQIITGLNGVQKEWVGTKVHWELMSLGDMKTRLNFKHEGLIPEFICFNVCTRAWDDFLHQHLVSFLDR